MSHLLLYCSETAVRRVLYINCRYANRANALLFNFIYMTQRFGIKRVYNISICGSLKPPTHILLSYILQDGYMELPSEYTQRNGTKHACALGIILFQKLCLNIWCFDWGEGVFQIVFLFMYLSKISTPFYDDPQRYIL